MHAPALILEKLDYLEAEILKIAESQKQIIDFLTKKSEPAITELELPKYKMLYKIVQYLSIHPKVYSKQQITLFLYLIDLHAIIWSDESHNGVSWLYSHNGPWSPVVDLALSQEITPERDLELPRVLELRIDNIVHEWGLSSLDELLRYVFSTLPMIDALHNKLSILNLFKQRDDIDWN